MDLWYCEQTLARECHPPPASSSSWGRRSPVTHKKSDRLKLEVRKKYILDSVRIFPRNQERVLQCHNHIPRSQGETLKNTPEILSTVV